MSEPTPIPTPPTRSGGSRPLRRSRTDRMLGGVCGGIAAALGVDPVLLRIAAVALALSGGAGVLAYVIAWMVIPEAESEDGTDDPAPEPPRASRHSVAITVGACLVGLGALLLLHNWLPGFGAHLFWPLVVVAAGVLVLVSARRRTMTTIIEPPTPTRRRPLHWGRVVFGLLVAAVGTASLLSGVGVDVPWRLAPAIALIVIGLALLASLAGGTGRADLVVLAVIALVLAIAAGVGVERYAGPPGDRTVVPAQQGWPEPVRVAAGTVVLDLTGPALPPGRAEVAVGAGEIVLRLPADRSVDAEVRVVTGTVVDDHTVDQGFDLHWAQRPGTPTPISVRLDVGAGQVEVDHVPA